MSKILELNTLSKEWLKFTVTSDDVPLDQLPVAVGIATPGTTPKSFVDAEWVVGQPGVGRVMVGPGTSLVLSSGMWDVWVQVTATPEIPVMDAGRLRVR